MKKALFVTILLLAGTAIARSAERVVLQNGFSIQCHHHAQVEDHIRLYMTAGEQNYIDMAPEKIVSFEAVPDELTPVTPEHVPAPVRRGAIADGRLTQPDLNEILSHAGQQHNVDVDLLASVVKIESGGNPHAKSHAGARGLMQLMPGTAAQLGVNDSFQPDENVQGGTAYLDALLTRYHDNIALALAAYNAGPGAVDKYHGIPPYHETRLYVAYVIHEFNRRVKARAAQAKAAQAEHASE